MADLCWPPQIPDRPLRENVGYQPMSNQDSFTPEDGDGFEVTWVKAAEAPLRMEPTYPMTLAEFERWLSWWRDETRSGTLPFQLRDPYDRQTYWWKLQAGQQISVDKSGPNDVLVKLPLLRVP